jgi:hypothetical protein
MDSHLDPQTQKSDLLELPADIIYAIDKYLEPAGQFAFRLSCTAIYYTLPPCIIEGLPNDPDESTIVSTQKVRFLQLIQDKRVTPCSHCCKLHKIKNVLRHPSWRDESPHSMCLWDGGTFNLCPCINITITDAWYIWNSFWGFYDLGTTDFTTSNSLTYRISSSGEFLHHCRAFPAHPIFSKIEVDIRGYKKDASSIDYSRRFGGRPNFQLCFDFEYRCQIIRPHVRAGPDTDPIQICPHTSLIRWDSCGNYDFHADDCNGRLCKTFITDHMESEGSLVVKVTRVYGDSTLNLLPYVGGLEHFSY